MTKLFGKAALGAALIAATTMAAAPADARDYYRYGRHHDRTGTAIAAGVVGLAIGAALASNNRGRYYNDRYYNDGYYNRNYRGSYYPQSYYYYPQNQGYYYDNYNRRYRDDYRYERKHRRWHRRHGY